MLFATPRRRPLVRTGAVVTAVALVVSVALAATAFAAVHTSSAGALVKTRKTSLGTILVNAQGRTLYLFMKDKRNKSSCAGQCPTFWPPFTTNGKPSAGAGAKASLLGTIKRGDGRTQVTYNGHPLYRFSQDASAGQTKGEAVSAFGAKWYAVSSAGARVMPAGTAGGGYGGGGGYSG